VRAAVVLAFVVLVLVLDVMASVRVLRSDLISQSQKLAWLAFAWLVPLLGAILALQVSVERSRPAPISGSYGMGAGGAEGGTWVGGEGGGCGHGGDGGCGDGGGH
jgi:Phospholipase_D-nuclease N-terminal